MKEEQAEKNTEGGGPGKGKLAKLVFLWACGLATGINFIIVLNQVLLTGEFAWQWLIVFWLLVLSWFAAKFAAK